MSSFPSFLWVDRVDLYDYPGLSPSGWRPRAVCAAVFTFCPALHWACTLLQALIFSVSIVGSLLQTTPVCPKLCLAYALHCQGLLNPRLKANHLYLSLDLMPKSMSPCAALHHRTPLPFVP